MGQKSSDRETIPLCSAHHQEQHRIGLRQFAKDYELDISALVEALNEKPRLFAHRIDCPRPLFYVRYRGEYFNLFPVSHGIAESVELAKMLCREYLIEQMFTTRVAK